jgi:hypothetical protein
MVQSADRQKHGQHERELIDPGAINDRFNWRKTEKKKTRSLTVIRAAPVRTAHIPHTAAAVAATHSSD